MFVRGYSEDGKRIMVGYQYRPVIDGKDKMENQVIRLEHRIVCAEKIYDLLLGWLWNSLVGLGILSVVLVGVSACYLVGAYLGLLA